jgi:hypothetical protein
VARGMQEKNEFTTVKRKIFPALWDDAVTKSVTGIGFLPLFPLASSFCFSFLAETPFQNCPYSGSQGTICFISRIFNFLNELYPEKSVHEMVPPHKQHTEQQLVKDKIYIE